MRRLAAAVTATVVFALALLPWRGAVMAGVTAVPAVVDVIPPGWAPFRNAAKALGPLVHTAPGRQFLDACSHLPPVVLDSLVVFRDPVTGTYLNAHEYFARPESARTGLEFHRVDYFKQRYGSTLTYTPVFELLGEHGVTNLEGRRILDFGYGHIGHLLALAADLGMDAVGVDIDPLLRAVYSEPGDSGRVEGLRVGRLMPITGWFPGDSATRAAVGTGYDLVISKNTLKGGHSPEERSRQRSVINLGVSDSVFVRAIADCMKPGGFFLMYTISGPKGNPACPFSERLLRDSGFDVVAYDRDDSRGAQAMMAALHHGSSSEDGVPDDSLTAMYTLTRKRPGTK